MRAALILAALLAVAGCGNDPSNPADADGYFSTTVVNVDGRQVPCITWSDPYRGGLSCDWSR